MGSLLVVDGSGVCRAPIVAYTLERRLAELGWPTTLRVEARGLTAEPGRTMCENAASRIGHSGPAIGYFGAYRAITLSVADVANADLVLTAERTQRSAVVRMLPGMQASVFTWREAMLLTEVLTERWRSAVAIAPADLAGAARALHGARGTVPMLEPAVSTGPFHWRRAAAADPLDLESGHCGAADHGRVTQESLEIAHAIAAGLDGVLHPTVASPARSGRPRRLRRSA